MARLELATPNGRLIVYGWQSDVMNAAAELALAEHVRGVAGLDRIEFAGRSVWFKRSVLRGKSRARWALKRAFGAKLPRVAEYYNHSWLTERLFETPLPLAAGELLARGVPQMEFLISAHVPDAITLETFLADRRHAHRAAVLDELARETARMHALGFVHHDLYPRNILVRETGTPRRLVFLDAWAGGPPPQLRGAPYDLACLFLHADTEWTGIEVSEFVARYAEERAAQGRPIDAQSVMNSVRGARSRLVARLRKRPAEQRGRSLPGADFE
ncbi:MAG: hypothetical protein JNL28_03010 [Planctomycetes bacterium]|nr:hypothetical protein [Planctomycetota bacterium]